jgi:hypothetical protein
MGGGGRFSALKIAYCPLALKKGDHQMSEFERTLKWLFDACFGRITATAGQINAAIHRLGTLKRQSRNDD